MTDTIRRLEPENIRPLLSMGEPTRVETAIGTIAAFSDGTVRVLRPDGPERVLSDNDVTIILRALLRANYAAAKWNEKLRGHDVVQVARRDGGVWVTWHGRSERMRVSKLRKAQACTACQQKTLELHVSVRTHDEGKARLYHARVCFPCVERLTSAPTGLRRVAGEAEGDGP